MIETLERLLEVDQRRFAPRPDLAFGLEARATYQLAERDQAPPDLNPRKFWIRPATEPATYSYWRRFQDWTLDEDSASELASCLLGQAQRYRTTRSAAHPNAEGTSALYPDPAIAQGWLTARRRQPVSRWPRPVRRQPLLRAPQLQRRISRRGRSSSAAWCRA